MDLLRQGAPRVVGSKQVIRAIEAGQAVRVYVASDADTFIYQKVIRAAEEARVPCVRVATMKELGLVSGIDVPTASAAAIR